MSDDFRPTLYLNHRCPFCLKLLMFVALSGRWSDFTLNIFEPGSPEHQAAREKLAPHFDAVSFPAAEVAPGDFRKGGDDLIAYYEQQFGTRAADLPLIDYYATGVFQGMAALYQENVRLKDQLEKAASA